MNIHLPAILGSLGARVLTHPQIILRVLPPRSMFFQVNQWDLASASSQLQDDHLKLLCRCGTSCFWRLFCCLFWCQSHDIYIYIIIYICIYISSKLLLGTFQINGLCRGTSYGTFRSMLNVAYLSMVHMARCESRIMSDNAPHVEVNVKLIELIYIGRRKFRSQTSDNMGRWKSRGGKSQRGEEKKRQDQRRERVRRKRMQVRENSGGSKSRFAKAADVEPSGQMRGWKVARYCGAKRVSKSNGQQPCAKHFWKLRRRKSARRHGAKHISKSKCTKHLTFGALLEVAMSKRCTPLWREAHSKWKCTKHTMLGALLEVQMSKKCTLLWREARFEVKCTKHTSFGALLDVQMSFRLAGARDSALCTLSKVTKSWGFCSSFKALAGVGHVKRICKDAFSVAGAVQETCSSEILGGLGADSWEGLHFGASDLQVC